MSDLALGVDISDVIARLVLIDQGGEVVTQGIVAANRAGAVKDAAKKAIASAKGKVTAVSVALPTAADAVPPDMAEALAGIGRGAATPIAAGAAAAIAEQWRGAARGCRRNRAGSEIAAAALCQPALGSGEPTGRPGRELPDRMGADPQGDAGRDHP